MINKDILEEKLNEIKLKKLNLEDLTYYLDHILSFDIYSMLNGFNAEEKARHLLNIWEPYKNDDLSYLIPFLKENNIVRKKKILY